MQRLREDPPACPRGRLLRIQPETSNLIPLEELQITDVIDLPCSADCLRCGPVDAEIEWLLPVRVVSRREIAADDQSKLVRSEILLQIVDSHVFVKEDLLFGSS